jgi:ribose transport system ATP-binding protein
LTDLCDRIAVLSGGQLAAVFSRGEWTAEKIMAASFSTFVHVDPAEAETEHAN